MGANLKQHRTTRHVFAAVLIGAIGFISSTTIAADPSAEATNIAARAREDAWSSLSGYARVLLLEDLARVETTLSDGEGARATLRLLLELSAKEGPVDPRFILAWAKTGDLAGARKLSQQYLKFSLRLYAFEMIGRDQASQGHLSEARLAAEWIDLDFDQVANAFDNALAMREHSRLYLLIEIAKAELKAGDINAARNTLAAAQRLGESSPPTPAKTEAIPVIAALVGDAKGADAAVAAIKSPDYHDIVVIRVATALLDVEKPRQAIAFCAAIQVPEECTKPIVVRAALQLASSGNGEEARNTLREARAAAGNSRSSPHEGKLIRAFGSIIDAQISLSDFDEAARTAAWFDELNRPQYLIRIANARRVANDLKGAKEQLDQAANLLARTRSGGPMAGFLVQLAVAQAKAGLSSDASKSLERLRSMPFFTAEGDIYLRASTGDFSGAENEAAQMDGHDRDAALLRISEAALDWGEFPRAAAAAAQIKDEKRRSSALDRVALVQSDNLAASGQLEAAIHLIADISDVGTRVAALRNVAPHVAGSR